VCSADDLPFADAAFDSISVAALQQVGAPARQRTAAAVIAKASSYEDDGKIRIPGVARCIAGTR
jgi:hypothetical protein